MAASRAEKVFRKPGHQGEVGYLELFFDLVFVFALTQLSAGLIDDVSEGRLIPLSQTLLLLSALLMFWIFMAGVTNLYDPQRPEVQLVVAGAMFGALVMAIALPDAFDSRGLAFAAAYVATNISRGLILVPALRGHEAQRRSAAGLLWFSVSGVPWILGATVASGSAREAWWTLAIGIEYAGLTLGFPAPWFRRPAQTMLHFAPEHLAERYRQFVTIILGELILVTGVNNGPELASGTAVVAFFVSFATSVLLWRTYLYQAAALLPTAITAAVTPVRIVRRALLAHVVIVAGIIAADVGYELVIDRPLGHTDPVWIGAIVGGPIVFLAGRIALGYAVYARVSYPRLIGALLLAGASPAMILLPPLAVGITAALVLTGIVVTDALLAKRKSPKPPSPPG